jgi:2-pyrone-4,6-dicarboxylate lactonase
MLDATGATYGVLVQVSVHGTDNSLLVEALRRYPSRLRGVAVVAPDASDACLQKLKDAGVVGLRLNTITKGRVGLQLLGRYEAMCAELGWHLQLFTDLNTLTDSAAHLSRLRVPYVIDHMGHFQVSDPVDGRKWQLMLRLMANGAWTKLSGAYRLDSPPYAKVAPFARSLIETAPDRCVWGSDWPHVGFWGTMPNVGDLIDLLVDWAPSAARRDAILTTNAQRLYGFESTHSSTNS